MKLVEVVYVGPADQVDVPAAGVVAVRNQPVEVPDDIAKSLLEQTDIWATAPATKKAKE